MSQRLLDFLREISEDNERLDHFRAAPDRIMEDAGLSAEEKEAIKSRDPQRIRALVPGASPAEGPGTTPVVIVVVI